MNRKLWAILAAVWFIATGLLAVTNLEIDLAPVILGVLAIATGILLLLDR